MMRSFPSGLCALCGGKRRAGVSAIPSIWATPSWWCAMSRPWSATSAASPGSKTPRSRTSNRSCTRPARGGSRSRSCPCRDRRLQPHRQEALELLPRPARRRALYQDYLEQLTFLLFLKMADERAALTGEAQAIPKGYRWADLANPQMEGVKLEQHYRDTLQKLGEQGGMLGLIFSKAQNKIQDPAKLRQLVVDLIGNEHWLAMSRRREGRRLRGPAGAERPGHRRAARASTSRRARSSRPSWTACSPKPGEIIADPACGTGGFLLAAHDYIASHYELDRDQKRHLRYDALRGVELVRRRRPPVRDEPVPPRHRPRRRRQRAADPAPTTPCATSPATTSTWC